MPSLLSRRPRLQDLAPFDTLGDIAKACKVELTLYGGTASRAAMHHFYRPDEELDIFDLAPFSSDIDLEHSGSGEKTVEILLAIQDLVPFANWFRWSIIDYERADKAAAQRAVSTRIPLREMRTVTITRGGWNGTEQIWPPSFPGTFRQGGLGRFAVFIRTIARRRRQYD
jgi:hypothetical protein